MYTATYSKTVNEYTITWKNYDGTVLEIDNNVEYGQMPSYDRTKEENVPHVPYRPADQQCSYTFVGWSTNADATTGITDFSGITVVNDITYYAIFKSQAKRWYVTFEDEYGEMLDVITGATTPHKIAYHYGDKLVDASFTSGNKLKSTTKLLKAIVKEEDGQYTYEFVGWKRVYIKDFNTGVETIDPTIYTTEEIAEQVIIGDTRYIAQYNEVLISYTITYNLDNGIASGNKTSYNIETEDFTLINPTKSGYTFVGWTGEGLFDLTMSVKISKGSTGNKTYYANYIKNDVRYDDFGAKADGKTNDFESLYKAHLYANANNSNKVLAMGGKTYYIGSSIPNAKLLEWATGIIDGKHTTNHNTECIYGANKEHINSYGALTDCHGNVVTDSLRAEVNNNLKFIKSTTAITINVATNVDWNTAKFIIDDTNITTKVVNGTTASNNPDNQYNKDIFTFVAGSYNYTEDATGKLSADKNATMTDSEFSTNISGKTQLINLNNQIKTSGINQSTTKLNLNLGYSAMVIIYNEDLLVPATRTIAGKSVSVGAQRIYIRYGGNANDGGIKRETILIDANGNIDPSTPIMYDYTRISKVIICKLSVPQIVVSGGEFTTLASKEDTEFSINSDGTINNSGTSIKGNYIKRGFNINRSNVVLDGVKHYVLNEYSLADDVNGLQGAHYNGFFTANQCANVMIKNCILTARRYYGVSGTYDFNANLVCGITLKNCTQTNFFIIENNDGTITNTTRSNANAILGYGISCKTKTRILWGVGGTNFCKNMIYDGSTLSRFDAHQGLYNGKVINSTVNGISVIGMGDMIVENSEILSVSGWSNNSVVNLRSDYGSTWKGNVYIKGVTATASSDATNYNLIYYQYTNHNFGYECYLPNLTVEDFTLTNPNGKTIYLFCKGGTQSDKYASSMHKATLSDGTVNNNIINMPEFISIDDTSKYDYTLQFRNSGESFSGVTTTECTIKWCDSDGIVLETDLLEYGKNISFDSSSKLNQDNSEYEFVGWSLTKGGEVLSSLPTTVTKDMTFYAVYKKVALESVTVNYLSIDGKSLKTAESFNYGEGEIYTINAPSISGYVANTDTVKGIVNGTVVINIYYSTLSKWDGTTISTNLSGTGTKTDPYLIKSAADLAYVKNNASLFSGKYLKMMVSVDVSKSPNFMIVGFKGHFDGNNCSIRGLNIESSSTNGVGFFSILSGGNSISNLSVYGSVTGLSGSSKVGGVVGYLGGKITNCHNYATITGVTKQVGGVVGHATGNSTGIINCTNYGSVTSTAEQVGGIIGYLTKNIEGCYNYGSVSSSSTKLGGIVGNAAVTATISDCHNCGNVTSTANEVGGVVGASGGIVKDCTNNALVSGNSKVAGIAGNADKATEILNCINNASITGKSTYTAGIAGTIYLVSNIRNCVNYGDITSSNGYVGGILAAASKDSVSIISDCSNYGNVKGSSEVGGVVGYSFATEGTTVCNCLNTGRVSGTVCGDIVGNKSKFTVYDSHTWTLGSVSGSSRVDTCVCGATREVDIWDGSSASTFLTGTGTEANPYLIQSALDLAYFANSVTSGTNYSGKYIKLTKSIDLNNKHLMIGNATNGFAGTFDGCNNFVFNMNIVNTVKGGTGLFAYLINDAVIKNIIVTGKVSGGQYTGSVAGYLNTGHLYNCINYADVTNTTGNAVAGVAGGISNASTIYNCINYGSVIGHSTAKYVGGVVGLSNGEIINCINHGSVTGYSERSGGIVGETTGNITNCDNYASVTGKSYTGGITGTSATVTISNSRNYGSVVGTSNYAGGILGCVTTGNTATINNCINSGLITAAGGAGAIAGGNIKASCTLIITNCLDNSETPSLVGFSTGNIVIENENIELPAEDEETLHILFISNSYGDDTKQWVHEIAQEYGVKINVANLYIAGCILDTHLANLKTDSAAYQYRYYEDGVWKNQTDTKISEALLYKDWDYIVLQQGSSQSGLADKYSALDEIMDRVLAIKNDVKFIFNMTWAYQQDSGHSKFGAYNNDQMTMYNGILNAVQTNVLTNDRIEFVIPNGTAVQNARTSYIGDTLCRDTSCHLSYEFGRYIAGLTFFSKVTGIDISDITYKTNITEEEKLIAIESVKNALANPYAITNSKYTSSDMPDLTNYTKIDWVPTADAYWESTKSVDVITGNTTATKFVASKKFTKEELPVGSIIVIESGYRYRPDGWTSATEIYTGSRPANITTEYIVVTEEWWGEFNYRGFNISLSTGEVVGDKAQDVIAAFNIYIPN